MTNLYQMLPRIIFHLSLNMIHHGLFLFLPENVESNPDPLISLYVLVASQPKLADPSDFVVHCC